ncbi:MAG: carboxypeptidase-like regulatory domain-containing protein, partial [Chitinophagaceae bacterium]
MRNSKFLRAITMVIVFVLSSLTILAQNRTITGVVSDKDGNPLANATISVKGGRAAAVSDVNGAFKIIVPSSSSILVVSYVGAKKVEAPTEGKSTVIVSVEITDTKLSEVVVIGYGSTKRSDVSSAISSVKTKDLKDMPVTGIDQAIQ